MGDREIASFRSCLGQSPREPSAVTIGAGDAGVTGGGGASGLGKLLAALRIRSIAVKGFSRSGSGGSGLSLRYEDLDSVGPRTTFGNWLWTIG
jgi:hypothetical protein